MNTYLVPTTAAYCYEPYDYIYLVYANTPHEAYIKARTKLQGEYIPQELLSYESYPFQLYKPDDTATFPFHSSRKYDILTKALKNTKGAEYMEVIDLYRYMYWGDYNAQIQTLADKALDEKWSFENRSDNGILKNYLENTFLQLQKEDKIIETDTYCLFNTGLFTDHYIPIYAYGEINKNYKENPAVQKWYCKGFKDEYELASLDIDVDFPERADYFKDTTLLVFDWHCKIHVNYGHILNDLNTLKRLPDFIKNSERPLESLKGYIDTAIQRVTANYKLAVPHYYQDKIQLMIPLCFSKDNTPDVALVLDKRNGNHYQARTCLTMEMAYMDARLIAKPESNWLIADNILQTD